MIERLLSFPRAVLRLIWSFIHPHRMAGRVALGRVAIVTQIIAALIFAGYTLSKKDVQLPLLSGDPYEIQVLFSDAQGLDRLDQPLAAVAGTPLGRLTNVTYQNGRALATLKLEDEARGKIFKDASVAIRPASALQNLLVNIDPGTPAKGPLPEDAVIPPERTTNYVSIDELTSVFDADTQAYVTIVIEQAELALRGREGELRHALHEVGELATLARPVSEALADRRELLTRLVGHLNVIFETLGKRGDELTEAIDSGSRTLEVTAARERELAEVTRQLGPFLAEAERALAGLRRLAVPLLPALEELEPAAGPLARSIEELHSLLPRSARLVDRFEALVENGSEPLSLMLEGTEGIEQRIRALVPIAEQLTDLSHKLNKYKGGAAQLADTLSGALSVQDRGGVLGQVDVLPFDEPKQENFGMEPSASRSKLEHDLALALELTCAKQGNPFACFLRFAMPGLPRALLSGEGRGEG